MKEPRTIIDALDDDTFERLSFLVIERWPEKDTAQIALDLHISESIAHAVLAFARDVHYGDIPQEKES